MNILKRTVELIDANLISCLVPIVLFLMLVEVLFRHRFETRKTLNLVRWTMIGYTCLTLVSYTVSEGVYPEQTAFLTRASGPYTITYWVMFLCSVALPFTLLIPKLAKKFWYVLLVAIAMKFGAYFERFVILWTSLHRDFQPEHDASDFFQSILILLGLVALQGIILTVLALGVFEFMKGRTSHDTNGVI